MLDVHLMILQSAETKHTVLGISLTVPQASSEVQKHKSPGQHEGFPTY
jgi:hypothetical protein